MWLGRVPSAGPTSHVVSSGGLWSSLDLRFLKVAFRVGGSCEVFRNPVCSCNILSFPVISCPNPTLRLP